MAYQSYQSIPQFQNQFQNQMYMQQPYQQPIQGMYMDRLSQLQSQQSPQLQNSFVGSQTFTPLGKIVESIDIVKATDIPMDGNMYYFPKADGTEVYMKRWLPNGTTEIVSYKPFVEDIETNNSRNGVIGIDATNLIQCLNDIQNDIKMLTDKVDKFNKPIKSNRKEVTESE